MDVTSEPCYCSEEPDCQEEPRLPCSPGKWQNEVFASQTEGHFYFFFKKKPLFSSLFNIRVFPAHIHRFAFTFFGCPWSPRKWGSSHSCFFGFLFSLVFVYFVGFLCFGSKTESHFVAHIGLHSQFSCLSFSLWLSHWTFFLADFSSVRPFTCFSVYSDWDDLG